MGFQSELNKQKNLSKSFSKMKGDVFSVKDLNLKVKETKFLGYKEFKCEAKILKIIKNNKLVEMASAGEAVEIILDKTVFYPESGGQVGDIGKIIKGSSIFRVENTDIYDKVHFHWGKVTVGTFKIADKVKLEIDFERRMSISRNHTATHILQAALRKVLGTHVQQQGSLVSEEKFRFDFTHFKGLTKEEISRVEEVANSCISKSQAVNCKEMVLKEAKKAGALAFFEEKYGENVRVVTIGDISKELCGGTHLDNISKIGLIKILSEGSVASGIRRIEGVTAKFAERFIKDEEQKVIEEAVKRQRLKELKENEKKRNAKVENSLTDALPRLIEKSVLINGINTIFSLEDDLDMHALRLLADKIKEKLSCAVVVLGSADKQRKNAFLVIAVTADLLSRGMDAGALIRQVAPLIGGSGGGRQDFAQAGGTNPDNFTLAFEKLKDIIKT